jgi:hypothetical protein
MCVWLVLHMVWMAVLVVCHPEVCGLVKNHQAVGCTLTTGGVHPPPHHLPLSVHPACLSVVPVCCGCVGCGVVVFEYWTLLCYAGSFQVCPPCLVPCPCQLVVAVVYYTTCFRLVVDCRVVCIYTQWLEACAYTHTHLAETRAGSRAIPADCLSVCVFQGPRERLTV